MEELLKECYWSAREEPGTSSVVDQSVVDKEGALYRRCCKDDGSLRSHVFARKDR